MNKDELKEIIAVKSEEDNTEKNKKESTKLELIGRGMCGKAVGGVYT